MARTALPPRFAGRTQSLNTRRLKYSLNLLSAGSAGNGLLRENHPVFPPPTFLSTCGSPFPRPGEENGETSPLAVPCVNTGTVPQASFSTRENVRQLSCCKYQILHSGIALIQVDYQSNSLLISKSAAQGSLTENSLCNCGRGFLLSYAEPLP